MMYIQSKSILVVVLGCFYFGTTVAIGPRVNTTSGVVEGFTKSVPSATGNHSTEINVFLGIPYAEPPVGDLRFSISRAKKRMDGIYNATDFGAICPQSSEGIDPFRDQYPPSAFEMDESCLFLNIYAPEANSTNDSSKAVMIWIHGGAYLGGTANIYDGSLISAVGDVVVVAINYRLGALGYLSTGDRTSAGNYGSYDQFLAIQWVLKNAKKFGGDPKRVTLFGESAGASSISLLTLNRASNLHFQRAIFESGTATVQWAMVDAKLATSLADLFGTQANCPGTNSDGLLACLRKLSANEMVAAQEKFLAIKGFSPGLWLGPIIDNSFFEFSPKEFMAGKAGADLAKRVSAIDHLIGTNSQEGGFIYNRLMGEFRSKYGVNDTADGMPRWVFDRLVNQSANQVSREHYETLKTVLEYRYTDRTNMEDGFKTAINYIKALSDDAFYSGIIPWAQFHARLANDTGKAAGSTYFYYFDHRGSWESRSRWRTGADHGDEIPFVFGNPFMGSKSSDAEKKLFLAMITFWTNFATTGNPNYPHPPQYPVTWPPYVINEEKYIRFSTDSEPSSLHGRKLAADRVAFWTNFLPNLLSTLTTPKPCPVVATPAPPTDGASGVFNNIRTVLFVVFLSALFDKHIGLLSL